MQETLVQFLGWEDPLEPGVGHPLQYSWASLEAQMVKNPPATGKTWFNPWVGTISWMRAWQPTPVFSPGRSPWTEEPGGLQPMGWQRVRHDWEMKHSTHTINVKNTSRLFYRSGFWSNSFELVMSLLLSIYLFSLFSKGETVTTFS